MIKANDPKLKSWVDIPANSDFSIQNIPFGIFKTDSLGPRAATAIGTQVLDLMVLEQNGYFEGLDLPENIFAQPTLNAFMELGKAKTRAVRNRISDLLEEGNTELKNNSEVLKEAFFEQTDAEMCMPIQVPNYTDFYSSEQHAFNVGTMFRGPENALMPNWKHIPVGYHGRASSIVVSGTDFHRPKGQTKADDADMPSFGPCRLLDFELEMGFITCKENPLGEPVSTAEADEYIFGFVLLNDWSARDIQKWEYVPLGPFLAKNFASHVSPWIVTMDALEPFTVAGPEQDPEVLPYLKYEGDKHFDVKLQVGIQPEGTEETVVSNSNFKYMYWNVKQQLAHHTVNGCNMQVGDLYGSGTISGPTKPEYGSMLEITWRGSEPVKMADGSERKFIQDGDTVIMRGHAEKGGVRVGFGEVAAKVLPAK
ncbi:fumarylacetoacetase [Roseivirga pacifica]|uniref:fumarylacetoacetase n=1 Tax=Roseivirga pacifica TaxID=1267423 RepID=UPI0020941F2F|nr:fumarylacetoacetase [Roseivirga pacifica]MCO6358344.1 fumarylacetoacetase [Roseivirga pacifica]MCO6366192.1 fumarylacetoacetase [Roseivirga pacifica]MCO6369257.1 fumarylacetoacetase [Roseivirga pacifica]MCO6374075.1 fumarylacetoacetase [Roseivirga pacifica]MCO6378451.1 fumarylacetoacetase [Roseivirga pacifica]